MENLISVIIPVYNVEKYLEECLDSIVNQTYKNLEIILVDDGSTDNSGKICSKYAESDDRITDFHINNIGVAGARNFGLKHCTGQYVLFVDSDDILELDAIEILYGYLVANNADIVCGNAYSDKEERTTVGHKKTESLIMDALTAMEYYVDKAWAPWNKLMKIEVHKDVLFPNYIIHEDEAIKFKLLERCKIVMQIFDYTYYYRRRQGSITDLKILKMDMFYSSLNNYCWLKQNYDDIAKKFLPIVCEDALYNLDFLCSNANSYSKSSVSDIVGFFKLNAKEILFGKHCWFSYKARMLIINLSNWDNKKCLYTKVYKSFGRLSG